MYRENIRTELHNPVKDNESDHCPLVDVNMVARVDHFTIGWAVSTGLYDFVFVGKKEEDDGSDARYDVDTQEPV